MKSVLNSCNLCFGICSRRIVDSCIYTTVNNLIKHLRQCSIQIFQCKCIWIFVQVLFHLCCERTSYDSTYFFAFQIFETVHWIVSSGNNCRTSEKEWIFRIQIHFFSFICLTKLIAYHIELVCIKTRKKCIPLCIAIFTFDLRCQFINCFDYFDIISCNIVIFVYICIWFIICGSCNSDFNYITAGILIF